MRIFQRGYFVLWQRPALARVQKLTPAVFVHRDLDLWPFDPPKIDFQDSWWNSSMSNLVILAAAVLRWCVDKQTDRQTDKRHWKPYPRDNDRRGSQDVWGPTNGSGTLRRSAAILKIVRYVSRRVFHSCSLVTNFYPRYDILARYVLRSCVRICICPSVCRTSEFYQNG